MSREDGKIIIGTEIDTKKFDAQLNALEQKAKSQETSINRLYKLRNTTKDVKEIASITQQINQQKVAYEKTTNQIIDMKAKIQSLKDATNQQNNANIKTFDKGISKIKRFGLALFSIRSIYSLVSRASSAYLAQDTEMANKLQSVWTGLGSFLAPLIKWITDILSKGLGYLNVFIKALTGVDYIANANAKAIKNQANAQKELNKQLYSFDEINKLSSSNTGGGLNVNSALFEMPELDDRIVKKMQDLAYWLKENWDWLKLVGEMFLIVFGATKIAKILSNIAPLLGSKGLGGILTNLQTIATIGAIALTIYIVGNIIKEVKTLKKDLESIRINGKKAQEDYIKQQNDINKLINDEETNRKAVNDLLNDENRWLHILLGLGDEAYKNAKAVVEQSEIFLEQEKKIYNSGKLNNEEKKKLLNNLIEQYNFNIKIIQKLEEQGKDTRELQNITSKYGEEIQRVGTNLGYSNDKLDDMVKKTADSNQNTKGIYDNIKNINNTSLTDKNAVYTITAQAKTKQAEQDYSNFFSRIGESASYVLDPKNWGKGFTSGLKTIWKKKMAVGGIINNPGHGVALGSNIIGGESGREGVLPLTDASVMSMLGAEIGKYVSVNNLVDVNYDGQRIKRISKSSDNREAIMRNR